MTEVYYSDTNQSLDESMILWQGRLDDFGGKNHDANVVLDLMEGRLDSGPAVLMDNYYNG